MEKPNRLFVPLLSLGFFLLSGVVHAEETSEPEAAGTSLPHTHDRLYVRLAAGGGYAHDQIKYEGIFGFGSYSGEGQGASGMFDLRAGWAIKPGIILGGGLFIEQVASPKVTLGGQEVSSDVSVGILTLFGPMIDWFPDAKDGFHLGGAIGAARITMKDKNNDQLDNQPIGGGGVFFIGYDFWVGDEWSVGVEATGTGATLYDGSLGVLGGTVRHTWSSGGVLLSVTYN